MRLWIDTLIALLLVAVLGIVLATGSERVDQRSRIEATAAAVEQLRSTVRYQAVMTEAADALAGIAPGRLPELARHVDPTWFAGSAPVNLLADEPDRPWIDLAPVGDTSEHPPDPVLARSTQAQFWFNPTTGVVRARVPMQPTQAQTLAVYRDANRVALDALPDTPDPARQPVAMALPGDLEVTQASPQHAPSLADAIADALPVE
jgi:hypothetical protein